MTVVEVFRRHGLNIDEGALAELAEQALVSVLPSAATPLPPDEAAIYDEAGFTGASAKVLTRQAIDTAARYLSLLASAKSISEAADYIGVTRPRMQQMVSAREVWAISHERKWALPAIQFGERRLLPGWAGVAPGLPEHAHPLEVLGLLSTPQPELELDGHACTIPQWLRSGGDPLSAAAVVAGEEDQAI